MHTHNPQSRLFPPEKINSRLQPSRTNNCDKKKIPRLNVGSIPRMQDSPRMVQNLMLASCISVVRTQLALWSQY